jgi:glycosyltransferase involved in cell wall biosynthesis
MLKALFLNKFFFLRGGAERVFFEEMSLLRSNGHEVIPFSRKHPNNIPSEYDMYFADVLNLTSHFSLASTLTALEIIYSFNVKKSLKNLIHATKPQIAHAHNIYGILTISALDVIYAMGIPSVISLHDYKILCPNYQFLHGSRICEDCKTHRYHKTIQNRCVHGNVMYSCIYAFEGYFNYIAAKYHKKVTKFIAVSRFIKKKFVEYGFPDEQIVFIPNFINVCGYEPNYQNGKYFLYLGRLSREKGIKTLIDAFRQLKPLGHKLVIAGDGPLRADLEEEVRRFAMYNVEFTGFLSGSALADKIKNCTCVVVPSEWYENCPISILEAMAYGKPVIGAAIGGIPELIEDKTDGLLFASGNADDLADKMNQVASITAPQLEQMGRSGRHKVEQHYNSECHYESLISLYQSILH